MKPSEENTQAHHSYSLAVYDGVEGEDGVVRHVGQDVDDRHDGHGDGDGHRQVPAVHRDKRQR